MSVLGENPNDKIETNEATNDVKVVDDLTKAQKENPEAYDNSVKNNTSLNEAKKELTTTKPEATTNTETRINDNGIPLLISDDFPNSETIQKTSMDQIYTSALEKNISPYNILAYGYEEKTTDEVIQATETDASMNAPSSFRLEGKGRIYQNYEQIGKIENNVMTGAVLDFTGSMSTKQIESMIKTFLDLSEKGIITPQTKISIMYDISDQDNEGENSDITSEKMQDTDAKIKGISFGENGDGLKNYLKTKGLVDDNWNVLKKGVGSTPLYSTILSNLMNSEVKEATVFTDGASDRSANQAIGPEEIGNAEAWDAMIHLCKTFNKKITIVAFNMKDEYIQRTENMQKYFNEKGVGDLLTIVNLGKVDDTELSKTLTENMTKKYSNITINEDPDMINGKKISISSDGAIVDQTKTKLDLPKVDNENVSALYDEKNNTYKVNLAEIFPGIDLSNYDISYKINSYASIEQEAIKPTKSQFESNTYILDISSSMSSIPKKTMAKENFCINPYVSFEDLIDMQESIRGFNYKKDKGKEKMYVGQFNVNDMSRLPRDKKDASGGLNFQNPDKDMYGLVLKMKMQEYQDILKSNANDKDAEKKNEELTIMLENLNSGIIDQTLSKTYNEILSSLTIDQKKQITNIYTHIYTLENITSMDRTPIIDAFGMFKDNEFCKGYENQTINFLTDFGDNESKGDFFKLYKDIAFDNKISGSGNNVFGVYSTYQKTKNPEQKTKNNMKKMEKGINEYFEDSEEVKLLQKNLIENGTTINFIYPGSKTPHATFYTFFTLLGKYINQTSPANPEGKQIITFQKLEREEDLFVPKTYQPKESKYKRESVSVTLTNKSNPSETITQTVKIGEKKTA